MRQQKRALLILFIMISTLLIVLNPSEEAYLRRVSLDYGLLHHGMDIPIESLERIGTRERTSYLIFSTYEYRFGKIGVTYVGCANKIWFTGSLRASENNNPVRKS